MASGSSNNRPTSFEFLVSHLQDPNYVPPEDDMPEEFIPEPSQVSLPSDDPDPVAEDIETAEEAMETSDEDSDINPELDDENAHDADDRARDPDFNPEDLSTDEDSINDSDSAASDEEQAGPARPVEDEVNPAPDGDHEPQADPAPEVQRGRKRVRQAAKWKKNIRKEKRAKGQQYASTSGNQVQAKAPRQGCAETCKFKCHEKLTQDERKRICDAYYDLGDYARQRDFICSRIEEKEPARKKEGGCRRMSREFSFLKKAGDDILDNFVSVRVCSKFFCDTLAISYKAVRVAMAKKGELGNFASQDKRGRHVPKNKTNPRDEEGVRRHIESFPSMEAHYCRKDTRRKYLASDLSIKKLAVDLYPAWCTQNGYTAVKENVYRRIFTTEYNLGFHVPKKDQCATCSKFKNLQGAAKDAFQSEHELHLERKVEAQEHKKRDKKYSQENNHYQAVTFDLEAVLYTPYTDVSLLYYKRKLAVYNFTIYEQDKQNGYCYIWPETDGKRGSNEIATCLYKYFETLPPTTTHVSSFSDTCGGQNRNVHVASAMLHAVRTSDHLKVIDFKYMESGHSSMEVDSMHSSIEKARRYQKIYNVREWSIICRGARRHNPYNVQELTFQDFHDFHQLSDTMVVNRSINADGEKVNWLKIKWFRFQKDTPTSIFYKEKLSDELFKELPVTRRPGNASRGTRRQSAAADHPAILEKAYDGQLPISIAKKDDLMSLVTHGAIPQEYEQFYSSLPSRRDVRDALPEPDAEEQEYVEI